MKQKLKICNNCQEPKVIWKNHDGNRYCQRCWASLKLELPNNKPKPTAPRQPIARVSDKRSKEERIYSGRRILFLLKHPRCQANLPGTCTGKSCEVHHKKGRTGKLYLDERFWLAACSECHKYIELHPNEAKALGLSLNRLENNEDNTDNTITE